MYKKILFTVALFVATMSVSAQKLSGNISPLKGQKEVNVVLDFTGTMVNGQPEESHIAFFSRDKNEEEIAKWLQEWNVDLRNDAYETLIKYLNLEANKKGFAAGNFPNAEYTILVKVLNISPGAYLTIGSDVKANVSFAKTGENTPFATVEYKKIIGKRSTFSPHQVPRIVNAFSYLGSNIGSTISKNLK